MVLTAPEHLRIYKVAPILLQYVENPDEGVRSTVAESLGRLTLLAPAKFLPNLVAMVKSKNAPQRLASISALRFSFSPAMNWSLLSGDLELFLDLLSDADLEVKRQAFVTLDSLMLVNIDVVRRELLSSKVLPALYAENKARKELIEEKDWVAFKETIDHGLPLRKQVYNCYATLLRLSSKRIQIQDFIQSVKHGLADAQPEVQIQAFEIFNDVARDHSAALLEFLDQLPDLIVVNVKFHIKEGKNEKGGQKSRDVLRAIVASMLLFNRIPGIEQCNKYLTFYKQVLATPILKKMAEDMEKAGSAALE